MNEKLENAFKHIDMTYQELVEIADSLTQPVFAPINQIVNSLTNTGYLLSIDQIRDAIWQLQIKAYELSEIKEKSTFRADLADAIQKEQDEGAEVTDSTTTNTPIMARSFGEAMSEAKELWTKLVGNGNAENVEKIKKSIINTFGVSKKLSEIKEEQQELLEKVIEDIKTM